MPSSRSLQELVDRCSATITEAAGACARARELVERSAAQRRHAVDMRSVRAARAGALGAAGRPSGDAVRPGRGGAPAATPLFTVRGEVDGEKVVARRDAGGELACPEALYQRACVVVALGDTFDGDGGPPVVATLDGDPFAVALTMMRAMDRVVSVEIAVSPRPAAGGL